MYVRIYIYLLYVTQHRDRKRKKFVGDSGNEPKRIKTESGRWIKASYRSNIYQEWKEKHKVDSPLAGAEEDAGVATTFKKSSRGRKGHFGPGDKKGKETVGGLRSKGDILKRRKVKNMQQLARNRKTKNKRSSAGNSSRQK